MTVGELRALLADLPDDARVVVDGYEGGYSDPRVIGAAVRLDRSEGEFYGEHGDVWPADERASDAPCVLLSRKENSEDNLSSESYAEALAAVQKAGGAATG